MSSTKWHTFKELFWQAPELEAEVAAARESAPSPTSSANPQLSEVLAAVKDVQGAMGSIVVHFDGMVTGHDLPRVFDAESVQDLGRSMSALYRVLRESGTAMASGKLEYLGFDVHVRVLSTGLMGVLAASTAYAPALDMALNLAGRRVDACLASARV